MAFVLTNLVDLCLLEVMTIILVHDLPVSLFDGYKIKTNSEAHKYCDEAELVNVCRKSLVPGSGSLLQAVERALQ